MRTLAVLSAACLLLLGAAPARNDEAPPNLTPWQESWGAEPANVAFHVCLEEQDGVSYVDVLGPRTKLTPIPSQHVKSQVRNALKGLTGRLSPEPVVRFPGDPMAPEPLSPGRKAPGSWGDEGRGSKGYCRRCVCAQALYNGNKQFSGCSAASCDGCEICRPCDAN